MSRYAHGGASGLRAAWLSSAQSLRGSEQWSSYVQKEFQQEFPGSTPRVLYRACPLCESTDFRLHATADCSRHPLYTHLIPAKMTWMR